MKPYGRTSALALTLALFLFGPSASAALAAEKLPDLGMARLTDFQIDTSTISGRRLLRYSTLIVNTGSGSFEARAQRPDTSASDMSVTQRIFNDTGGYRDLPTPATAFYSGDGHNHWHVRDLETSELKRLDNGAKVGAGAKRGFCFYDNVAYRLTLPGAPQSVFYKGCGTSTSLQVTMGLSIGWGDRYAATLRYQYVDVTGLANGRYRLQVAADGANWFQEANDGNNTTWTDLRIRGTSVKVLAQGPSA